MMVSLESLPQTLKVKNKFSEEEDKILKKLVNTYGENNWELISSKMPNRNVRQCHDRWIYYISPNVNNCPWTDEEDQQIIDLVNQVGIHWVKIAKLHQKRTDIQIKNRWNLLKRKLGLKIVHGKVRQTSKGKKKTIAENKKSIDSEVDKLCDEIMFKDIIVKTLSANRNSESCQNFDQCSFLNPFNPISFEDLLV